MMKIKKITVSNLKAVSKLTADFNGCTAIITGGNNKGKTTFLRALTDRMRGIKPDLIVKQGEREGFYEMELTSGDKFLWEFKQGREKLTLTTEKNIKTSVTKEISAAYFPKVFDVDRFLTDEPKKQRQQIEKIAGIDFSELDRMFAGAYEERTFANRRLKEAEAKKILFEMHWKTAYEKADYEKLEALEQELHSVGEHNLKYKNVIDQLKIKTAQRERNITEIEALKAKIAVLENENTILAGELERGTAWTKVEKNLPKNADDLSEIKYKIQDSKKNIEAINLERAYEKALAEAKEADDSVKQIEKDKQDALKSSKLPDGFKFTDDGITYNGFPFNRNNLSSSSIYIGALRLAALFIQDGVRTLHFDASYLDKNNLLEIEKWAEANDLQLLIERPDFEGGEISYEIVSNEKTSNES